MNKYFPLLEFFETQSGPDLTLSFSQIEQVLGFKLPPSAYKHSAWWGNARTYHHSWPQFWMRAGWVTKKIDFSAKTVKFVRADLSLQPALEAGTGFWWVNHKQTHRAEIEGGYIWSPKAKQNGQRNRTYENLRVADVGDIVFSYADGLISAYGVVMATYREQVKPEEFGATGTGWHPDGWLVPIEWTALPKPVRPKEHLEDLSPLLPGRYSPIQANGNGNQGVYLASIPASLARSIIRIAGLDYAQVTGAGTDVRRRVTEELEAAAIAADTEIEPTFKDQLIRARVGQGRFRAGVIAVEQRCRLTGVSDERFLIASHIKPWAESDNQERLDPYNGLLLAPHVDRLFDRGWISFRDDGNLLVADASAAAVLQAWALADTKPRPFARRQLLYLEYHRDVIYAARLQEDIG